tara:strand:- start:157 stop:663 length:507 start_codon:yes stop_codon:yes gene_type:complete
MHAAELLANHYKTGVTQNDNGTENQGLGSALAANNLFITPGAAAGLSVLYGNQEEDREVSYTQPLLWTYGGELLLCTTNCFMTFAALGSICFVGVSNPTDTTGIRSEVEKWTYVFYGLRAASVLNSTLTPALVYRAEANANKDTLTENQTPKGGAVQQALKLAERMTY